MNLIPKIQFSLLYSVSLVSLLFLYSFIPLVLYSFIPLFLQGFPHPFCLLFFIPSALFLSLIPSFLSPSFLQPCPPPLFLQFYLHPSFISSVLSPLFINFFSLLYSSFILSFIPSVLSQFLHHSFLSS